MRLSNETEKQNAFKLLKKGGSERKKRFIEYVNKKVKQNNPKERDAQ